MCGLSAARAGAPTSSPPAPIGAFALAPVRCASRRATSPPWRSPASSSPRSSGSSARRCGSRSRLRPSPLACAVAGWIVVWPDVARVRRAARREPVAAARARGARLGRRHRRVFRRQALRQAQARARDQPGQDLGGRLRGARRRGRLRRRPRLDRASHRDAAHRDLRRRRGGARDRRDARAHGAERRRRPVRVVDEARRGRSRTRAACCRATAACSTASTRSPRRCRSRRCALSLQRAAA